MNWCRAYIFLSLPRRWNVDSDVLPKPRNVRMTSDYKFRASHMICLTTFAWRSSHVRWTNAATRAIRNSYTLEIENDDCIFHQLDNHLYPSLDGHQCVPHNPWNIYRCRDNVRCSSKVAREPLNCITFQQLKDSVFNLSAQIQDWWSCGCFKWKLKGSETSTVNNKPPSAHQLGMAFPRALCNANDRQCCAALIPEECTSAQQFYSSLQRCKYCNVK